MRNVLNHNVLIAVVVLSLTGCGASISVPTASSKADSNLILNTEPSGAKDVLDIREKAKDLDPVVVLGRVGGGVQPWIEGRAAFIIVDERVVPSCKDEHCDANCKQCAQELASATTMIKFVDSQGKVLPVDSRELLGIKEQQTVVVRGVASRDKSGNLAIKADGIFVRR